MLPSRVSSHIPPLVMIVSVVVVRPIVSSHHLSSSPFIIFFISLSHFLPAYYILPFYHPPSPLVFSHRISSYHHHLYYRIFRPCPPPYLYPPSPTPTVTVFMSSRCTRDAGVQGKQVYKGIWSTWMFGSVIMDRREEDVFWCSEKW